MDPLTKDYPSWTPYAFAMNRVIDGVDLDGLEWTGQDALIAKKWSNTAIEKQVGEIALGFVPYVGQGIDAKDTYNAFFNGGSTTDKVISIIGWIPFGDFLKGGRKLFKGTDEAVELALKNLDEADEIVEQAFKNLDGAKKIADVDMAKESLKYAKRGSTGKVGENFLKKKGGVSQKWFPTKTGKKGRFIDQFVDGVAHEAKTGYTSLTKEIKEQIAKDAELLANPNSGVKKVVWNFFRSPLTGKAGASKPLQDALKDAGIETVIIN